METLPNKLTKAFPDHTLAEILENVQRNLTENVQWRRVRCLMASRTGGRVGLCVNALSFHPEWLQPCLLQFHQAGRQRLLQDKSLQAAIAHAYWQTCWAGGAVRVTAGETKPVAFVAIDRSQSFQAGRDYCALQQITAGHFIFGTENIFLHTLTQAAKRSLYWQKGKFGGQVDGKLLAWLNEKAFVDRFIGDNKKRNGRYAIERFVPVSGSHIISCLLQGELAHFCSVDRHLREQQVIAATNSGFFLNFPEEYSHKLCAMNDPVGLLIADGKLMQLPLTRRGAILIDHRGQAAIQIVSLADFAIKLPWKSFWRQIDTDQAFHLDDENQAGKNVVVYTPAFQANRPPREQKTPEVEAVDFAVVFGKIVEAKQDGGLTIPANGIVISCPANVLPGNNLPDLIRHYGSHVQLKLLHRKFGLAEIKTALGAGPVLLHNSRVLPDHYFTPGCVTEQFQPAKITGGEIRQAGTVPTRFPHDANKTRAPRTILGLTPDNRLILAVIDGRDVAHSLGATLKEAARIADALGCTHALNLDGGGSSVMYIDNGDAAQQPLLPDVPKGVVNIPSDSGHQDRLIPAPLLVFKCIGEFKHGRKQNNSTTHFHHPSLRQPTRPSRANRSDSKKRFFSRNHHL